MTEWSGHCVSMFSPRGEKLQFFGTRGSGQGQFNSPAGVAVDGKGNVLVIDCRNHRIQKFTTKGQFLTALGIEGSRPLQLNTPTGIAVNTRTNKVYAADTLNHNTQVLTPSPAPLGRVAVASDSLRAIWYSL